MAKRKPGAFPRIPKGSYDTPQKAVVPLLPHLTAAGVRRIWEPCAGKGALLDALFDLGADVDVEGATDVAPRDPRVQQLDALALTEEHTVRVEAFVTNPPWPEPRRNGEPALSILWHLCSLRQTWALLPLDFMANVYAAPLMRQCIKVVIIGRVKWIEGSEHDALDNCAWYLFGAGHRVRNTQLFGRGHSPY